MILVCRFDPRRGKSLQDLQIFIPILLVVDGTHDTEKNPSITIMSIIIEIWVFIIIITIVYLW